MPEEHLLRIWRGYRHDRSGEIVVVPQEPNFLGALPHSGPWNYLQHVPMFWYGPGHVPAVGAVNEPVTLADVAPTQAAMLGFDFRAPDGVPMRAALGGEGEQPPRLIVTVVWDGGGRNVLSEWGRDWPHLRSLIPHGAWYDRATVGSSPSITPPSHATLGTGAFPRLHGQTDSDIQLAGQVTKSGQAGPGALLLPTLADLYDQSTRNRALTGIVATVPWHINMLGHGSLWGGGDRDIAVLRTTSQAEGAEGQQWNLHPQVAPYFRMPRYVNDLPGLERHWQVVDRADGALDGRWRDEPLDRLDGGFLSPARIPYQTDVVLELIRREGFGADAIPDLMFVNYKLLDHVGHIWSLNSPYMQDGVAAQDADLARLTAGLDEIVGRGRWVLLVTADHGHQYDPAVSGGFPLTVGRLEQTLRETFDTDGDDVPAIRSVKTTQVFVDREELAEGGHTVEDVARFILELTEGRAGEIQGIPVPEAEREERVFAAAIPSELFVGLPCLRSDTVSS
jgi:hypothetical protein